MLGKLYRCILDIFGYISNSRLSYFQLLVTSRLIAIRHAIQMIFTIVGSQSNCNNFNENKSQPARGIISRFVETIIESKVMTIKGTLTCSGLR